MSDSGIATPGLPILTIEDKVTFVLMLIMKQMDKEIERQLQHIQQLQSQQNKDSKDTSVDVETMKMKRLIEFNMSTAVST